MTNDGKKIGGSRSHDGGSRLRRPLPVKTRSGTAVAGLTLALSLIAAIGLPFARYAAHVPPSGETGRIEVQLDGAPEGAMRLLLRIDGRGASAVLPGDAGDAGRMPEGERI